RWGGCRRRWGRRRGRRRPVTAGTTRDQRQCDRGAGRGSDRAEKPHERRIRPRPFVSWAIMSGFVDTAQTNVKGGDGGAGCVSFRREAHVPKGGPDGGDGGRGGDVWLRANRNVASLLAFRDHPHRKAGSGTHGKGQKLHGKNGGDL